MEIWGQSLSLKTTVETRFFSQLIMIERLLEMYSVVHGVVLAQATTITNELQRKLFITSFTLSEDEIDLAKFFGETFKIMYLGTLLSQVDT